MLYGKSFNMSKNLNFAANVLNYRGPKWFKDFLGKGHY
jgi:hypothetical protein